MFKLPSLGDQTVRLKSSDDRQFNSNIQPENNGLSVKEFGLSAKEFGCSAKEFGRSAKEFGCSAKKKILVNFSPFLISLSAPGRLIRNLRFTVMNQEIRNEEKPVAPECFCQGPTSELPMSFASNFLIEKKELHLSNQEIRSEG
jgi:hypothetical protein